METAICSSISRAAGLGDPFWRANLRDVAAMAMSSDQNQSGNRPAGKGKAVLTGVVPPSFASSSTSTFQVQIKAEQNVMERLALEFSSLPDRELVPEGSDSQQLTTPRSSSQTTAITSNTPTNHLITKTIRAAMSDINKPK